MISLEQIHTLERKVQAAVSRIRSLADERDTLTAENATLKERLESYEERVAELQTLVSAFKADQEEIEAGIVAALGHLDELEDTVSEPPEPAAETPRAPELESPEQAPEPEATAPPPPEEPQPEPPAEDAPEDDEEADPELDIF
jgi:chromosome segregation ATPase